MIQLTTDTMDRLLAAAEQALQRNDHAEAEGWFRKVLAIQPRHAPTVHRLGLTLALMGRTAEALPVLQEAGRQAPQNPEIWCDLASIFLLLGRGEEALAAARQALGIQPESTRARNSLTMALRGLGRPDELVEEYRRMLKRMPGAVEIWTELGRVLLSIGRLKESEEALRHAITVKGDHYEAWNDLGVALELAHRLPEAAEIFGRAIAIGPQYLSAHNNLGNVLKFMGRLGESAAAYRHAIEIDPNMPDTRNNLAAVLMVMGRCEEAIAEYRRAMVMRPTFDTARTGYLYCLHFVEQSEPEFVFQEHRQWDEITGKRVGPPRAHENERSPERRLRIGYVSSDFRGHSVSRFMEGLLTHHDRKQVEVFCFADPLSPDAITDRLRGLADQWRPIHGIPDAVVAQRIRDERIDILVDLHGHTAGTRLTMFCHKPAPVQVTYLGYPDTTGLSTIDYRLTDAWADPVHGGGARKEPPDRYYAEELVRLPDTFLCYRPWEHSPEVAELKNDRVLTFASFNALPKISPRNILLWSEILKRCASARLIIKSNGVQDAAVRHDLLKRFADLGIVESRITLLNQVPGIDAHLALYGEVDVALDTYPYHGTTTTCEALWMGVPVVTLAGGIHSSRVGVSILMNVGLKDLIAPTSEEYVELAVKLAGDVERRVELRRTLRERMRASPLMDERRFAGNMEAAYRRMWRTWCASGV